MKKLLVLLLTLTLFSGCSSVENQEEIAVTEHKFNIGQTTLVPFYCVDEADTLWRIESDGAYSQKLTLSEKDFKEYIKDEDTLFFTTGSYEKNGIAYGTLLVKSGNSAPETIMERVRIDSVRVQEDTSLLFIDEENNLFLRRDGIVTRIEGDVSEAEFVGEDTFLFRLNSGKNDGNEILYPIYSATADYRNFLVDGADIIATDPENGKAYIIKNKRTVQKRAAAKEVADCLVYGDGEILFDIPATLISQFNESKHMFLICVNENASTLKYDLYRVDGAEPIKKGENIIWGGYISKDRSVYAYEIQTPEEVQTCIVDRTDNLYTYSLGAECSLENIYYLEPYTYVHKNGELLLLKENGEMVLIDDGIGLIKHTKDGLVCFKEKNFPNSAFVCVETFVTNKTSEVVKDDVTFKDGLLYYYSGDGSTLSLVDRDGNILPIIKDIRGEFISSNGFVAAVKKDGKMYIANSLGEISTEIKVKRFIKED